MNPLRRPVTTILTRSWMVNSVSLLYTLAFLEPMPTECLEPGGKITNMPCRRADAARGTQARAGLILSGKHPKGVRGDTLAGRYGPPSPSVGSPRSA